MVDDADRQARLCLSCALDGGDPAVMGLVARHGPAAAWSHILNGAMGEPTAERAGRLSLASVERLAAEVGPDSSCRGMMSGLQVWPTSLMPGRSSGVAASRTGCGCTGLVTSRT